MTWADYPKELAARVAHAQALAKHNLTALVAVRLTARPSPRMAAFLAAAQARRQSRGRVASLRPLGGSGR